jgi:hypothetical protein
MKRIAYLFSATAMVAILALSSCKKKDKDDPTPDDNPTAPTVTASMTSTNQGMVDVSMDVNNSTGTAKIRLDVTHTGDLDEIFIMKSEDNGTLTGQVFSTITTSAGLTFTGGSSDESFDVPGSTKSFILDIPVTVRTTSSAVTDVYYIWITNGNGSFLLPTKNRVLGAAKVTLKYNSSASTTSFQSGTVNVGDQTATPGSLLVTSGQISALLTASYNDAPESADIAVVALDITGNTKTNGSSYIYLVSPDIRDDLGFTSEPAGANTTNIELYTTGDFETITGAQLQALSVSSTTKVAATVGAVYKFSTEAGKKGLMKVNSITHEADGDAGAVVNVSIKVLN